MHGTNSTKANRSKIACDTFDANRDKSVDDANWFAQSAQAICSNSEGKKAWIPLRAATGFDDRDCQRYAAGHVKPTAYFLRRLLRSCLGWQFLAALMAGSDEPWWAEVVRAKRIAAAVDREI